LFRFGLLDFPQPLGLSALLHFLVLFRLPVGLRIVSFFRRILVYLQYISCFQAIFQLAYSGIQL
jgi:hypothetical protein